MKTCNYIQEVILKHNKLLRQNIVKS